MWDCHWTFNSPHVLSNINELSARLTSDKRNPSWSYLREYDFDSRPTTSETPAETLYDVDNLARAAIDAIRSKTLAAREHVFKDLPTTVSVLIFDKVRSALSETDFRALCSSLSSVNDHRLLEVCFDCIIHAKLTEREEASLSTVSDIKDLARSKPEQVTRCINKLITNETNNFADSDLLEGVYSVLPEGEKESIVMAIINMENFKERNWKLLQVLPLRSNSKSFKEVINCMSRRCEEFGKSQAFAKFLLKMCKNVECSTYQDVLKSIVDRNQTILKRQMLKLFTS